MSESEGEKGEEKASEAEQVNPADATPKLSPALREKKVQELTKAAPPPEPRVPIEKIKKPPGKEPERSEDEPKGSADEPKSQKPGKKEGD